ncbi:MAG TPA: PilN domain-containing protein [Candidatus Sericytochromatia bacterium]
MYSLDVNFLNDRPGMGSPEAGTKLPRPKPTAAKTPLYIGVAVGLLLPALVGGLLLVLQQQVAQKEQQKAALDSELGRLQIEQKKITQLTEEITRVNEETTALASVFNQIKPWSAMLQDIRERIPPGVQISNIQQITAPAPPPAANAQPANAKGAKPANAKGANATAPAGAATTPPQVTKLEINGTARSFDDVNYFLLTLQRSSFFKGSETELVGAQLVNNPTRVEVPQTTRTSGAAQDRYELPKVVQYKIQTNLSDVPASELLRELDRKGAVGLVTRIRTLQEKGVIQP